MLTLRKFYLKLETKITRALLAMLVTLRISGSRTGVKGYSLELEGGGNYSMLYWMKEEDCSLLPTNEDRVLP